MIQSTFQFPTPTGRQLRDEGIKRATERTEQIHPGWQERALSYVKEFVIYNEVFLGEDIRTYAEERGFDAPSHKRAWGAVMMTAAKKKIVEKIGTRKVKNPRAHTAIATLWRRV